MKNSPTNERVPQNIITFVQEGTTHTINFEREPGRKLGSVNVAQCHILEINNRDANNKRTVMSLSHFTVFHLINQEYTDASMKVVIDNFIANGGNLSNAQFIIYGGVEGENGDQRDFLKSAISKICPSVSVEEPESHASKRSPTPFGHNESIDYLFDCEVVTFRKAGFSDDEYLDEVSENLKDNEGKLDKKKVDTYQDFMSEQWQNVGRAIESQTGKIVNDLINGERNLNSIFRKIEANKNDPVKIEELFNEIKSQVGLMSLKVCDRNGLIPRQREGIRPIESAKLDKELPNKDRSWAKS